MKWGGYNKHAEERIREFMRVLLSVLSNYWVGPHAH